MTAARGSAAIAHLLDDPEDALTYAMGMASEAIPIIEGLLNNSQLEQAPRALRALEVCRKHDSWPSTDDTTRLLDLAGSAIDDPMTQAFRDAIDAALVKAAEWGVEEGRFRQWCRLLRPHLGRLNAHLPPSFRAPLAAETLLSSKRLELEAARTLAESGRDDLLIELLESEPPPPKESAAFHLRVIDNVGIAIALALDARDTRSPLLGRACIRAGLLRVFFACGLAAGGFRNLKVDSRSDRTSLSRLLTERLVRVAPECLSEWVRGVYDRECALGFTPFLREVPGAALKWLASVRSYPGFADLVAISTGVEVLRELASDEFSPYDVPHWEVVDAAASGADQDNPPVDIRAPGLHEAVERFRESDAGQVLSALQKKRVHRQYGLPIALAVVDHLLTPDDLAGLLIECVQRLRHMRAELQERLPETAFVPIIQALAPTPFSDIYRSGRRWIESLQNPASGWRALAFHGPTPVLRGFARARLAAGNVQLDEPADRADLACVFGHQDEDEPVTPALVLEARRLLTDAFIEVPEPVEFWGALASIVEGSGDEELQGRLRRCWLKMLDDGHPRAGDLTPWFLKSLSVGSDKQRVRAGLESLRGSGFATARYADKFIASLPADIVEVAARSIRTPMMLRLAAIAAVMEQPGFDSKKLDFTGSHGLLVQMLDPWRARECPRLVEFALERAFHLLIDQPLDPAGNEEESAPLIALREAVRGYRWDPELRRDVIRQRLRNRLLKVHHERGQLVPSLDIVEAWLRAAAWIRDWPDGRLRKDVEEIAGRLDPNEKAALLQVLTIVRAELAKQQLEPVAELELVLKALVLRRKGGAR